MPAEEDLVPRATVLAATFCLAVATAATLLGLAPLLTSRPVDAGPATANTTTARAFVAAVAEFLQTGDRSALDTAVAPNFVDHPASLPPATGRDALRRHLSAVRASFTALTVTAADLVADGDRVAVRVAFHGTRRTAFLGIPLVPEQTSWQGIHVLRIAHGQVAERWSEGDAVGLFAPLGRTTLARVPPAPTVALARFSYAPASRRPGPALPGPGLLVVEAGALTVRGNGTASLVRPTPDGTPNAQALIPPGPRRRHGPATRSWSRTARPACGTTVRSRRWCWVSRSFRPPGARAARPP